MHTFQNLVPQKSLYHHQNLIFKDYLDTTPGFEKVLDILRTTHPNLTTLEFSIPVPAKGSTHVLYKTFPYRLLPRLKSLTLHRAKFLTTKNIIAIADHLSKTLDEISIHTTLGVQKEGFVYFVIALGERAKVVEFTFCAGVGDEVVKAVGEWCPNVRRLGVRGGRVTDVGVGYLCGKSDGVEGVAVAEGGNADAEHPANSSTVTQRAKGCYALEAVDLSDNLAITMRGVEVLCGGLGRPYGVLEWVDVTGTAIRGAEVWGVVDAVGRGDVEGLEIEDSDSEDGWREGLDDEEYISFLEEEDEVVVEEDEGDEQEEEEGEEEGGNADFNMPFNPPSFSTITPPEPASPNPELAPQALHHAYLAEMVPVSVGVENGRKEQRMSLVVRGRSLEWIAGRGRRARMAVEVVGE